MSDERPTNRTEFRDLQRELSGAGGAKAARFFSGEHGPRAEDEKRRKRAVERTLSELERLLLDPTYQAAFQAANDAIDTAQNALDKALQDNARHIADLEDKAAKLPDGRAVFVRADGKGETADGEIIPLAVMLTLGIPPDAPTIDQYNAARDLRRQLGGFADEIDDARRRVNAPNDPMDQHDLSVIPKDMDEITRQIEARPEIRSSFNPVASSDHSDVELDLTAAPSFDR